MQDLQKVYNYEDKISLPNLEKEVKDLTLEDLYKIYEEDKISSFVKIVNNEFQLVITKEEE